MPTARRHNEGLGLSRCRVAALDEIFQAEKPVAAGCDVYSTCCLLLSPEEKRDALTWCVRLLELRERGFRPVATVADAGPALRAGQKEALPGTPCCGDVFHAQAELTLLVRHLEARAYEALAAHARIQAQLARPGKWRGRHGKGLAQRRWRAEQAEAAAVALADEVALLARWLREDVLAVAGPRRASRKFSRLLLSVLWK